MLFEGIREPIEQCFPLSAVMRLLLGERRQPFGGSELVEPASPPRAAFKHSMQIGSRHHAAIVSVFDPAQLGFAAQLLAGDSRSGAATVQFKALQLKGGVPLRPSGGTPALPQCFVVREDGAKW